MKMQQASAQKGFTIIELVVVILLLGILAAVALPRFINVSTQAHNAVVDGVQGGLQTGVALFRAQWTAQGQPAPGANQPIGTFGNDSAATFGYNAQGYPSATTSAQCVSLYQALLQEGGRPTMNDSSAIPVTALILEGGNGVVDFVAAADDDTPANVEACLYYYVSDAERLDPATAPLLTYTFATGNIVRTQ